MFVRIRRRAAGLLALRPATRPRRDEHGASLIEYALLLALIAVVAIGALEFLGKSTSTTLNDVAAAINTSGGSGGGGGGPTTTTTTTPPVPAASLPAGGSGTETTNQNSVTTGTFTTAGTGLVFILVTYEDGANQTCNTPTATGGAVTGIGLIRANNPWNTFQNYYGMCVYSAKGGQSPGTVRASFSGNANYGAVQIVEITGDITASTVQSGLNLGSVFFGQTPAFTLDNAPVAGHYELAFGAAADTWTAGPAGFTAVGTLSIPSDYYSAVYFGTPAASSLSGSVTGQYTGWGTIGVDVKP